MANNVVYAFTTYYLDKALTFSSVYKAKELRICENIFNRDISRQKLTMSVCFSMAAVNLCVEPGLP